MTTDQVIDLLRLAAVDRASPDAREFAAAAEAVEQLQAAEAAARAKAKGLPWGLSGHADDDLRAWAAAMAPAGSVQARQVLALFDERDRLLAGFREMLAELERDYAHGVANGYWPEMGPKLDRWRAAVGLPALPRYEVGGEGG